MLLGDSGGPGQVLRLRLSAQSGVQRAHRGANALRIPRLVGGLERLRCVDNAPVVLADCRVGLVPLDGLALKGLVYWLAKRVP